jgi:hypothetical protein
MRFADPVDLDVGNWDMCTDNIFKALKEKGFVIVPVSLLNKIPDEPPMSGKPQVTLEDSHDRRTQSTGGTG